MEFKWALEGIIEAIDHLPNGHSRGSSTSRRARGSDGGRGRMPGGPPRSRSEHMRDPSPDQYGINNWLTPRELHATPRHGQAPPNHRGNSNHGNGANSSGSRPNANRGHEGPHRELQELNQSFRCADYNWQKPDQRNHGSEILDGGLPSSNAAAARSSGEAGKVLARQLECPVCANVCSGAIYMCPNGHNVCSDCQPQLESCPICRCQGRPAYRNLLAEELGQNVPVDCKNSTLGCKRKLPVKQMNIHLRICKFSYSCMFHQCRWNGAIFSLAQHAASVHQQFFIPMGKPGAAATNAGKPVDEAKMMVINLSHRSNGQFGSHVATAMLAFENCIFWYHSKVVRASQLHVQIRLIGSSAAKSPKTLPEFSYELEFCSVDGVRQLNYKNRVRPLNDVAYDDVVFEDAQSLKPFVEGPDPRAGVAGNLSRQKVLSFKLKLAVTAKKLADSAVWEAVQAEIREDGANKSWNEFTYRVK